MGDIDVRAKLAHWKECVADAELASELDDLSNADDAAIADAFFQDLAFGTAGLRGIIGVGTNRMNIYTVARATQGLADYLNAHFDDPSVAIARDSRHKGQLFVNTAASVLAMNGIRSYVYPRVEPTPALSFAVRDLGCSAGINMTASHNPAAYNGYKVYGADGCQITSEAAREISDCIARLGYFEEDGACAKIADIRDMLDGGLVNWIGEDTLARFENAVLEQSQEESDDADAPLDIVYTPLCGTGLECVQTVLAKIGVPYLNVVPGQDVPDGDFQTCEYPNPEERAALEKGIELCRARAAVGRTPDLLLATDPDADRVGVAVPDGDDFALITGNEMGILLMDFIARRKLERGESLDRSVAITTIVSSAMADEVAEAYGFELRRVLTGFKYIGEQIAMLEAAGEAGRFMFGFEESYGYLAGTHVRDKDAVVASMLICQMARYYRARGMSLVDAMEALYERFGYCFNRTVSLAYPGADGAAKMADIMARVRHEAPAEVAGLPVERVVDYNAQAPMPVVCGETSQILPCANVVELALQGGCKLIVRPSGTEPKIKAYLFARADSADRSAALLDRLDTAARELLA